MTFFVLPNLFDQSNNNKKKRSSTLNILYCGVVFFLFSILVGFSFICGFGIVVRVGRSKPLSYPHHQGAHTDKNIDQYTTADNVVLVEESPYEVVERLKDEKELRISRSKTEAIMFYFGQSYEARQLLQMGDEVKYLGSVIQKKKNGWSEEDVKNDRQ